jgi:pyruvate dehydrogenase E1 component alpha subunit
VTESILDGDDGLTAFRQLVLIRRFEERCEQLFAANKVRGAMHLYSGQEAVAVGTCRAMSPDDALAFTYRSHGWALARGISAVSAFAEIFGRVTGCSAGRGGSKHLGDWDRRIIPSNAIVGAHIPISVGVALADQLRGRHSVSVTAFGDGAMNQGVVHEAMTLASLWKLPVVFVCENNQYGEMTPVAKTLPTESILDRAAGHGIQGMTCDGMDVDDVTAVMARAIGLARTGQGPVFVEAQTYRFCGHHTGDAETYRDKAEVERWRQRDPLLVESSRLTPQ